MSFQDDLLRNMRTKDEAEAVHNEEMMQIAAQHAQHSISKIKKALLTASYNGDYEIVDKKKMAFCYISFPEHCQHFLTLKDESEYTPATPSNFELHLRELTQAAPSQRKAILKKYKGVNLAAGGSPAQYRRCVRFNVDTSLNHECGCYIHMLSQYCNDENITFDIAVYDTYKGDFYPLHTPIYNISTNVFDYRIYTKCSCLIPDKYSSDIPFSIDKSILTSNDNCVGTQDFKINLEITQNHKVKITWEQVETGKLYQILRLDSQSRKIVGNTGASITQFTDDSTIIGEDYTYQVVCTNTSGNKIFSDKKSIRVKIIPQSINNISPHDNLPCQNISSNPAKATNTFEIELNTSTTGKVKIKWDAIINAQKYQILRFDKKGRKTVLGGTDSKSVLFTDTHAVVKKEYTYQVVCITKDGLKIFSEKKAIKAGVEQPKEITKPKKEVHTIDIDSMDGHQFERFCGELLRKNGYYDVDVTRGSGDQGIDIIAFKDGVKFGIQCKCYSADIGNKAVQEAYSGKAYYNCHVGVVLTNRYFTRSANDLAKKNGILLWDRGRLLDMVKIAKAAIDDK